jgi:hypothetical protein
MDGGDETVFVLMNAEDDLVTGAFGISEGFSDFFRTAPGFVTGDGSPGSDGFGRVAKPIGGCFQVICRENVQGDRTSNCSEDIEQGAKRPDYFRYLQWAQLQWERIDWLLLCSLRRGGATCGCSAQDDNYFDL